MPKVHGFLPLPIRKHVHAALQANIYVLAIQPLFLVRVLVHVCVMCSTLDKQGQIAFDHVQLAEIMCTAPSKSRLVQNSKKQTT